MKLPLAGLMVGVLLLSGCGFFRSQDGLERLTLGSGRTAPAGSGLNVHATIPAPDIPPELSAAGGAPPAPEGRLYSYTLDVESPGDPTLAEDFETVSQLGIMIDEPATMATLEQRLKVSVEEGQSLLQSRGYYDGLVDGRLEPDGDGRLKARFVFTTGSLYKVGATQIILAGPLNMNNEAKAPPSDLTEVELEPGSPARASDILAAVNRAEAAFRNRGYPEVLVENTRYTLDRAQKVVEARVYIKPGPFARMGPVLPLETPTVDQSYLDALRTWKVGEPWNHEKLENFLIALRQSGLFQSVEAFPSEDNDAHSQRAVNVKLAGAPERTVGGMVSFDTDFGPGLTGYWEHRNLTGHGDRLRVDMPLWADMQELTATYRYPYFRRPDQDIIARAGLLHEDTDAYKLVSGSAAAGIERRLSRRWRLSVMAAVEGGSLEDPDEDKKDFFMVGLPVSAVYDSTNSLLDPTKGLRLMTAAAPYTGTFRDDFNVVRTRLEAQGFIPMGTDRLVLALRGVWGALWGADNSQDVPSALRFYSGGGGSVRGYDYQSVGPRNEDRDPLGGVSQVEMSAETRWRFAENMGLVAFVDGGMVYENVDDPIFQDLLWGAGLGFRYYTPIGPIRADVAFPLDKRPGDDDWQLYISIGQSF